MASESQTTIDSDRASRIEALTASDTGCIDNAYFEGEVLTRARSLIEANGIDASWVRPLIRAVERRRLRLPTLSTSVSRVIELVESPDANLDELASVVSQDPGLATRIMGVANSSFFRGAAAVENVHDALMRMGMREARTILIVVSLRSVVLRAPGQGQGHGKDPTALWRHSLRTATLTHELASECPPWAASGFLVGMVHDLGQLVLQAYFSELPAWRDDGLAPDKSVCETLEDALHSPLGAFVLSTWGFGESLSLAVLNHHSSAAASEDVAAKTDEPVAQLTTLLDLGNRIAEAVETDWPESVEDIDPALLELASQLGVSDERLFELVSEADVNFQALSKLS